jgi:Flp pilus assembly pilin Flp
VKAWKAVPRIQSWIPRRCSDARTVSAVCELDRGHPGVSRGDRGASAVEYAIMAGLIACVIVAAVTLFGVNVSRLFDVPSSVFHP